ncbi:hypothetical protein CEXT_325681 [Caerostris extrusa]|uniref:Uncharacterized protein n=1 Tax=Caerostris extrusa TaxID=172846 RepID=A0AAV4WRU9_CAEEX|nr:hypothetical protein CEXT_325681 [Caerostris extrusa]
MLLGMVVINLDKSTHAHLSETLLSTTTSTATPSCTPPKTLCWKTRTSSPPPPPHPLTSSPTANHPLPSSRRTPPSETQISKVNGFRRLELSEQICKDSFLK